MSSIQNSEGHVEHGKENLAVCYICAKPAREGGVCHHCGKLVCEKCMRSDGSVLDFLLPKIQFWKFRLGFDQNPSPIPSLSVENKKDLKTVHCPEHYHISHSMAKEIIKSGVIAIALIISGIAVAISIGRGTLAGDLIPSGLILLGLLAIIHFGQKIYLHYYGFVRNIEVPKSFPMSSPFKVKLEENANGHYQITGDVLTGRGDYLQCIAPKGQMSVFARLRPKDKQAANRFESVYGASPPRMDWDFGYGVIDSMKGIEFLQSKEGFGRNVFHLLLKPYDERPHFENLTEAGEIKVLEAPYRAIIDDEAESFYLEQFPVILIPSLAKKSGNRFRLRFVMFLPEDCGDIVLKHLTIHVPLDLPVLEVERGRFDSEKNEIQWVDMKIDANELFVFTSKVNLFDRMGPDETLTGSFEVEIPKTLYHPGIESLQIFDPMGTEKLDTDIVKTEKTGLKADFTIEARALSYQFEYTETKKIERNDLIPDYNTIERITETLTESGTYVAKITDNPPTADSKSAHVRHRYWDILGKNYSGAAGLFGVKVHVVVSGEEYYQGDAIPYGGETVIEVTTRTMVHDEESRTYAADVCELVQSQLKEQLETYIHPFVSGESTKAAVPEDIKAAQPSHESTKAMDMPSASEVDKAHTVRQEIQDAEKSSLNQLLAMKRKLMERFINGEITESVYTGLNEDIERDIANFSEAN